MPSLEVFFSYIYFSYTPPKFDIASEKRCLEDDPFLLGLGNFSPQFGLVQPWLLQGAPPGHHVDVPIADSLAFGFRQARIVFQWVGKYPRSRENMHKKYNFIYTDNVVYSSLTCASIYA